MTAHRFELRVYYEDTDLAGIVYYANYLKFIERARTEALLAAGIDQVALERELGSVFAVRALSVDYRAPARFQDVLTVRTTVAAVTAARARLIQEVWRADELLVAAEVDVVCLGRDGRPRRLPEPVRAALGGMLPGP
ncbi:MAG TPA: tol-pal system-associated acyl-CoA thioesterase [Amaricoccus sp.]|uniref:tol-pal system-associated acyl-CoA thioesterase n=1 Tax=Amaricoccus sp. TaxID=1872485 RepID=UPI002C436B6C|nr:tol-pal system-associated acyl-CoA thioesterase [Amaricoccus sp.]HMQ94544.1 tol-pal system-associated acyl-CoA thioesterase [Amaricoccus sp.]HMR51320.1 tol-pal system-associated acyl-CoA thioesterase [Amaricoccus sp.]HMR61341.1 tol-pal system-associated acyl-CoA thioesterase [Amaricoccus sp.]HMT98236.1 tol-pal system-associated acyl-CoA thioesterase [Amaricoccus sp.]